MAFSYFSLSLSVVVVVVVVVDIVGCPLNGLSSR